VIVYCFEKANTPGEINSLLDLLNKCLFCLHNNESLHKVYYSETLNCFGILCYYKYDITTAINFYFLALMQAEGQNQWVYYHNIADSLTVSRNFKLAEQYFKLCIEKVQVEVEGSYSKKHQNHLVGIFKLNYIECLLKMKDLENAKKVFSSIDPEININQEKMFIYSSLEIILSIHENPDYISDIQELKAKFLEKELFITHLLINELLINHLELSPEMNETILLENIKVSNHILNMDLKRQSQVEIIKFYNHHKNEKAEFKHLKELYKIDSKEQKRIDGELQNIFIQEMSVFIGNLKKQNSAISSQKTELEEITYILSHDLKTPLRIISSFSDLAQRKIAKKEYSEIDEYLTEIKKSSKNLHQLVEDVNTLHSIEQNKKNIGQVDLNLIANKVIGQLKPMYSPKSATVNIKNKLPIIQGIPSNFFIVFQNLIENGLKYNKSVNPTVSIYSTSNDRAVQLFFKDNGLGIEKEYHEYIFHYFKRLHTSKDYEGTGFGLGICKKIINNAKGTIRVESNHGEGSTFIVNLPISN